LGAKLAATKRAQPTPRQPTRKIWRRIYLREWREYRGLSVDALGKKAKVSPAIISLIENRKSAGSPDSLEKLARALVIDVGELFDVKPDKDRRGSVLRLWVSDADHDDVRQFIDAISSEYYFNRP
jgi:transcriptional regulator with XRE-family HTH domain